MEKSVKILEKIYKSTIFIVVVGSMIMYWEKTWFALVYIPLYTIIVIGSIKRTILDEREVYFSLASTYAALVVTQCLIVGFAVVEYVRNGKVVTHYMLVMLLIALFQYLFTLYFKIARK